MHLSVQDVYITYEQKTKACIMPFLVSS